MSNPYTDATREIRVFLSSTFKDTQAERNHLIKHVFPPVRERCAERGVGFTEIDLRWGVTEEEAKNALQSDELAYLVKQDMQLAAQLGINAVPFFVINDKYGISGAQQPELFLEALEKTWEEFSSGDKGLQLINSGDSCDIDGNCN